MRFSKLIEILQNEYDLWGDCQVFINDIPLDIHHLQRKKDSSKLELHYLNLTDTDKKEDKLS